MRRHLLAAGHVLFSILACAVLALTRRGGVLAFTHLPDVDGTGRDAQMGPLVDALAAGDAPLVEVAFVPLGGGLWRKCRLGRRLFVSYAAIAALGRIAGSPERAARWLLLAWRPRVAYLIDESGSGQPLVRAARDLGIRTVGIQHGDFRPGNPQYDLPEGTKRVPADVLCVWSDWFRERLLRISPIYEEANTRVTGRLRYPVLPPARGATPDQGDTGEPVRVLLLAEADPDFAAAVAPFTAALAHEPDLELAVRAHPGAGPPERDLVTDLQRCHVAVGRGSSALFEAVYRNRPVILLGDTHGGDAAGIGVACAEPGRLPDLCRRLAAVPPDPKTRERIWGGAPDDPVTAVLAAGSE